MEPENDTFEYASLQVTLKPENHSATDLSMLAESLNGIACASVWAVLAKDYKNENSDILKAREILSKALKNYKAGERFFPRFSRGAFQQSEFGITTVADLNNFDPNDPYDVGVTIGLNTWLRKVIQNENEELYKRLFSFAEITRAEHHSPLLIELVVGIGVVATATVLLAYGMMRAAHQAKNLELEQDIRKTESELKKEELKQRQIQTSILEQIEIAVKEKRGNLDISPEVLQAAATISSPSVAEFGKNPLIGSVTLGLSTKPA